MRLTYIFAAAASLLGLVTAVPAQHVDLLLKTIADKERELIRVVDTITVINAPLILVGQGPFPVSLQLPQLRDLRAKPARLSSPA